MVRFQLRPGLVARLLVVAGALLMSAGAALVYLPAGLILAGIASAAAGLFLVDVEGAREPRTARPFSPR